MEPIRIDRHDGWAEVVMNRPERRNAIDGPFVEGLIAALVELDAEEAVRAIVLRGEGGAFCSGLDLKAFAAEPKPDWAAGFSGRWHALHDTLIESRKVIVGALERYAINGGASLALAPDLLVCGETAYLQIGEIQLGMTAAKNIAWLVLRHGEAVAARLALLGDRVAGPELARLGVATEVVPDAQVVERACALAQRIAGFPADSVARIKSSIRAAGALRTPREWFDAAAAHDALAAGALMRPGKVT